MPGTVLTEYQSACRAAHQQVQLLRELYEHFAGSEDPGAATSIDVGRRIRELAAFQETLSRRLEKQDLLPMRPDPEKEALLELMTDVKAAFSGDGRPAADERLAAEESELLALLEQMLEHSEDAALSEGCAGTRDAIAHLSATEPKGSAR